MTRIASRMLAAGTLSARRSTDRTPFCCGPTTTLSDHGRAPSSPRLTATPPPLGRRMLRLILSNVHLLPRCWSSTTRLPFLRPISFRFCPSRPVRLRLSSQSRPASNPFCVVSGAVATAPCAGTVTWRGNVGAMPASRFEATPVASGFAVSPADTVTWPSGVIRTASSASTRLRLSARSRPIRSAVPDSFTSAFGAVATMTWSRSRTTISRMRTAIRIRPARSICVPPTATVLPWPIFSSIAAASQGVATSRLMGPAPSRHHSPPKQPVKITASTPITIARRLTQRSPVSQSCSVANLSPSR